MILQWRFAERITTIKKNVSETWTGTAFSSPLTVLLSASSGNADRMSQTLHNSPGTLALTGLLCHQKAIIWPGWMIIGLWCWPDGAFTQHHIQSPHYTQTTGAEHISVAKWWQFSALCQYPTHTHTERHTNTLTHAHRNTHTNTQLWKNENVSRRQPMLILIPLPAPKLVLINNESAHFNGLSRLFQVHKLVKCNKCLLAL